MNDLLLAVINMVQVVALAYLAYKQAAVKRDLREYNGTVERTLDRIDQKLPPAP